MEGPQLDPVSEGVDADHLTGWSTVLHGESSEEAVVRTRPRWTRTSWLFPLVALPAVIAGTFVALDRYFPEIVDLRGVDGEPPAIIAQPAADAAWLERVAGQAGGWLTGWPIVLVAPIVAGVLVGLVTGWLRWRMGRAAAAEALARTLESESREALALVAEQTDRLGSLQEEITTAQHQIHQLTGQLTRQSQQLAHRSEDDDAARLAVETLRLETLRLNTDLEDALAERDELESQVTELKRQVDAHGPGSLDLEREAAEASRRLHEAEDMIGRQSQKLESLEHHLDQVRRRAAELAAQARSADQMRRAWEHAERIIVDLSEQVHAKVVDAQTYAPQPAVDIVSGTSRNEELERLLNEAIDVIESFESQLEQTRFQLGERDAALARADVHREALMTEVGLLTEEIDQAAYHIAALENSVLRHRQTDAMVEELRAALDAERQRANDLDRQLHDANARALRLEERILGPRRGTDQVVDLTEPLSRHAS